jgi:hypothetical protein
MQVCAALIMVAVRTEFKFPAFYWSAGFGTFLQVSALASYWLDDFILRQRRRKMTNIAPTNLQYKQQDNPLL